jgi:hypothetical protein
MRQKNDLFSVFSLKKRQYPLFSALADGSGRYPDIQNALEYKYLKKSNPKIYKR